MPARRPAALHCGRKESQLARHDPLNRARFWQSGLLPGLSLLTADFASHDYAPHSHEAIVVAATEAGGSEFTSRGRTAEVTPTAVLAFNPDEPHAGRMGRSRRWRYRGFYLEAPAIAALTERCGLAATPYFLGNAFADPALAGALLTAHRRLEAGDEDLALEQALVAALGALLARHAGPGGRPAPAPRDAALLARLGRLIQQRHAERLTLQDLAAPLGLTPFQLIGLCRRGGRLTPHAWLTQVRLAAALALLRQGESAAAAAQAAGFCDQPALNRHCKRLYGITPGQYLAGLRAA